MYKVGDKFIIEIDSVMTNKKGALYGINGFNSLVFDENGLDRLEKAKNIERLAYDRGYSKAENDYFKQTEVDAENTMQAGYEKGLSDAWECMKKILDMTTSEQRKAFNTLEFSADDILEKLSPQEAIDKLKAWEEKQEIKVGDVISSTSGSAAVVQYIDSRGMWLCFGKNCYFTLDHEEQRYWEKTSKHIDLTEIFKGLEAEDAD